MFGPLIIIMIFKVPEIDHQQYFTLFVVHNFFSFLKQKFIFLLLMFNMMSEPKMN